MIAASHTLKIQNQIKACSAVLRTSVASYRRIVLLFFVFSWLPGLNAQTNAPAPAARSNRYLLIVETSRSMQRRSEGVFQAIHALLASSLGGQIRNGDTLGVWTYNEELSAGKLTLQRWSVDAPKTVTSRVIAFVKEQKFEKQGRFEKVLPTLGRIMKNSELITVLLISDGTEVHGTGFDDRINEVFKTWRAQQQDARMPFVTVMRAYKGKLTDCLVNPAPWVVELPPLPLGWQAAKVPSKPPATVSSKPATSPTLPPLVITGKKPEPAPATNLKTGQPQSTGSPTPSAAVSPIQNALTTQGSTPSPGQTAAALPSADTDVATPPSLLAKKTESPQANVQPPSEQATSSALKPQDSLQTVSSTVEPSPVPNASSSEADNKPMLPQADAPMETDAQVAAVPASGSFFSAPILWAGSFLVVVAFIGAIWFWRSRTRTPEPSSLITQSFDRDKK
jgi:hypothetical protein